MIPKYNEMYREILEVLKNGEAYPFKEVKELVAEILSLSEEERNERLESGKKKYDDRISWGCTYLKRAGLVENTKRGVVRITNKGLELLESNPEKIDNNLLSTYKEFTNFLKRNKKDEIPNIKEKIEEKNQTPQDVLEESFKEINKILEEEILEEVLRQSPEFFEYLVVKLLQKIGYGSLIAESGIVTKKSNDEGIDGIIKQDKLGFDSIYIQAKKWDRETTVSRPEIQKFVGALGGKGASKGLFITTAKFSDGAMKYSKEQHIAKVVLIDGRKLAKLMIEYNVGVSVESTYEIKRIDSDFFENID
ncbi:MAG: restriction endonuclease [Fusobacterium perfoetens]|uniref:restriction endonuclease n=1 Tax=Fusobacterium perfoetens TaxID=852 RepID=UPI0023F2C8C4|nr:restriction endonuclease [Fusobacterium perfoetens]MCI6151968.1 restriction endonuclease [Fusobacterium perfoetens]MDY3237881.1 restriction endonuclease [Fusobacterium perfoetens]